MKIIQRLRKTLGIDAGDLRLLPVALVVVATLIVFVETTIRLLQALVAGIALLELVTGIAGIIASIVSSAIFYFRNFRKALVDNLQFAATVEDWIDNRIPNWPLTTRLFAFHAIVLIVLVFVRWPVFDFLADRQMREALNSDNLGQAEVALEIADILGSDVADVLQTELLQAIDNPDDSDGAYHLAELTVRYMGDSLPTATTDLVVDNIWQNVANANEDTAHTLAGVLVILDPARAGVVADASNDAGVDALDQVTPDLRAARLYFEVVRILDSVDNGRSDTAKSIARFNLAWVQESVNEFETARTTYREAIYELDEANLDARYALSSMLLIHFSDDKLALTEAIEVARTGREDYIGISYCRGAQDLSFCAGIQTPEAETAVIKAWYCFALTTTEAGARLARGDEAQGDIASEIRGLSQYAVNLAEANDQFNACQGMYTAEAYYYLAKITAPETDLDVLCQITDNHDPFNTRHRLWKTYADEQRGDRECPSN